MVCEFITQANCDVPDWMSDELAVLMEPVAGGVHAALRARIGDGDTVAVIGAGTMGLVTVAALRHLTSPGSILIGAKYPIQHQLADEFGADVVCAPNELSRAVRRATRSFVIDGRLSGGADVVIGAVGGRGDRNGDRHVSPAARWCSLACPGSSNSTSLRSGTRPNSSTYTYGTETLDDGRRAGSFELALELAGKVPFDKMVSASYPLDRYREAIAHAGEAGPRGAVKVVFDMRNEKRRFER